MPSNTAQKTGDGKVRCRMVNDEIPTYVCEQEQGVPECRGCTSPNRRCTKCGKTRGIVNAADGLCETCTRADGNPATRTVVFEGTPDLAISSVLDRVRDIADSDPLPMKTPGSAPQQTVVLPSPKFANDPVALYPILMEHGNERDGIWKVSSPIAILMKRFHLLRHEATRVLSALAEKKLLRGETPWNEVILIKTDGIEEIRAKIDRPRADSTKGSSRGKPSAGPTAAATVPNLSRDTAQAKPLGGEVVNGIAELPSMQPIATYGELHTYLVTRSHDVRGERLVGGAVPALQIRFKLSAAQALESLGWLLANGHVQQKDGWRTIVLLSSKVESSEGPAKPQPTEGRNPHRGGWSRSTTPQRPSPAPTMASSPAPTPISEDTMGATSAEFPRTLEAAIAELEHALPSLRKQRDELAQHVAQLEASCIALKAMHGQLGQTQQMANASLTDAVRAAQSLLSLLRK